MYKVASSRAQDVARRLKLSDLCTRGYEPSEEEQRESLKARVAQLSAELARGPTKARRAEIGQEICRFNLEINRIKPKWKGPDLGDCLLKVIKAEVTKHQWAMWVQIAESGVRSPPRARYLGGLTVEPYR